MLPSDVGMLCYSFKAQLILQP